MQSIILASVFLLIFTVGQGNAIRCYECNSHNDSRCAEPIPPSDLSVECGTHKKGVTFTLCRKITQVIEFSVNNLPPDSRVIRACGYEQSSTQNSCYQRAGFGGRQEVCACTSNNCNGAGLVKSAFLVTVFGAVLALLFNRV